MQSPDQQAAQKSQVIRNAYNDVYVLHPMLVLRTSGQKIYEMENHT
jgi:hypothetical protein